MATALVQNGAKVFIASRKEKALKEVADNLNKHGSGTCSYIVADLSSKAGCDKLAAEVAKQTDKVHILINNSGVTWGARYAEVPEKEGWDKVYGTWDQAAYRPSLILHTSTECQEHLLPDGGAYPSASERRQQPRYVCPFYTLSCL